MAVKRFFKKGIPGRVRGGSDGIMVGTQGGDNDTFLALMGEVQLFRLKGGGGFRLGLGG